LKPKGSNEFCRAASATKKEEQEGNPLREVEEFIFILNN
jgi:hypothetical protein